MREPGGTLVQQKLKLWMIWLEIKMTIKTDRMPSWQGEAR